MHLLLLVALLIGACGTPASEPLDQSASALCVQDQPCTTDDGCQNGLVDCASGALVCAARVPAADGTECAGGRVCQSGACTGCGAGRACFEALGCRRGAIECSTGAPVCSALVDEPDGKPCLGGACFSGACQSVPADAGTVEEPDAAASAQPPTVVRSGCPSGFAAPLSFALVLGAVRATRRRG